MPHGPSDFELAGQRVAPGCRANIDIPAAQLYTHTPLTIPVEVVHGRRDGPVLLVCAAIHGDELNGVEIIRRLLTLKNITEIRGTLIAVPVVNVLGFIHRSRYLPDRRDLNRCFPGSDRGSLGSRMANLFLEQVVSKATHVVDLHTGAVHRSNLPQIRASLGRPGVAEIAHAFGVPVIVNAELVEGSLREVAGRDGVPVITYEAGEALRFEEASIAAGVAGVINVMRFLRMHRRSARRRAKEPFVARSTAWVRAGHDGVFRPFVSLGARLVRGDVVGVISDPFGELEREVLADADGIVIGRANLPLVNAGDALFHIARFADPDDVVKELAGFNEHLADAPYLTSDAISGP